MIIGMNHEARDNRVSMYKDRPDTSVKNVLYTCVGSCLLPVINDTAMIIIAS